jgi:uncharacterized membrane protein YraQ (UPF0718 family)
MPNLTFFLQIISASWDMLLDSSLYILFGIAVGGMLKMFLSTEYVVKHLGHGRYKSVVKAALFGVPIPLCSCGVLPAAASLKKQGANNGATTAFLISTPESGVDSISISYALLDPILTIARPVAAFLTALTAGFAENYFNPPAPPSPNNNKGVSCAVDDCCDGKDCSPADHKNHHTFLEKIRAGSKYAIGDLWGDLAGWFFVGILLAGIVTVSIPDNTIAAYLGGGITSMLLILTFGIPLYICATASTPVAAALIMKGVSPGTALVFLLVGPATNVTSISVLIGLLGKRASLLYLAAISIVSVICGLLLDAVYLAMGISASAVVGQAAEIIPYSLQLAATIFLLIISVRPVGRSLRSLFNKFTGNKAKDGCGCNGSCPTSAPDKLASFPKHNHKH